MSIDRTEQILQDIAQLLAEDKIYPLENTLLYAILDDGYVNPSIFKEDGDKIIYRDPDLRILGDALIELWKEQGNSDRWIAVEYVIRGGRFDVAFVYADEFDWNEDMGERRDRVIKRYFGDKPVVYPSWPPDADYPSYDL